MKQRDAKNDRTRESKLGKLLASIGKWMRVAIGAAACAGIVWWLSQWYGNRSASVTAADWILLAAMGGGLVLLTVRGKLATWIRQRALLVGFASLFGFAMLETYIRVFDPFPILLRGGRISLPVNVQREFTTADLPGLDETISVRCNSLGFRGQEPPTNWEDRFTMVCVGGSTTQCLYLSEGTTWPDRLAAKLSQEFSDVWLNNAGIDGHSTFGHLELLEQYLAPLRPKLILFYIGLNDVDRGDLNASDLSTLRTESQADDSPMRKLQRSLLRSSDAFALLDNFRMQALAKGKGLTHGEPIAHRPLSSQHIEEPLSEQARAAWLASRDPACLDGYKARVRKLVERCEELDIRCVLITQAVLYGDGVDDLTGIDLEGVRVGEIDGTAHWQLLQLYNRATMEVAEENKVPLIPLADNMPKSSRYFYDLTHLNIEGAEKAASLLYEELSPLLREWDLAR